MKQKNFLSFTLIEVLIVIVIIGILAAALVPRLQDIQARARDTKRKADSRTINNAIAIFIADNSRAPVHKLASSCGSPTAPRADSRGTCTGAWMTTDTSFYDILPSVPTDPLNVSPLGGYNGAWVDNQYVYNYLHSNTYSAANPKINYDLLMQLENKKDPDRCEVRQYTYYRDNTLASVCGSYSKYLYSPH